MIKAHKWRAFYQLEFVQLHCNLPNLLHIMRFSLRCKTHEKAICGIEILQMAFL